MSSNAIVAPTPSRACRRTRSAAATLYMDGPAPALWSPARCARFIRALKRFTDRPSVGRVVLTGPHLFEAAPDEALQAVATGLDAVLDALLDSPVPVVAAIPADAAGAGLELAVACSARVATPAANFSLAGIGAARLPRPATLTNLPQQMGAEAAAWMVASGTPLSATLAHSMGFVVALAADPIDAACGVKMDHLQVGSDASGPAEAHAALFAIRLRLRREAPGQTAPVVALRALDLALTLPRRRLVGELQRVEVELARSAEGVALRYAADGGASLRARFDCNATGLGGLAARLRWPMMREAVHLLDEGATPAQIDRCLQAYGFDEGPFARADRLGLAEVFAPPAEAPVGGWISYSATLDLMVDSGRHGGADAPGWYRRRTKESQVRFDPEVERLIHASAVSQRLARGPVSDEAITQRCLHAVINAAAAALEADAALTPSLVDAVWTSRLGFPSWKGGPFHQAAIVGLKRVVASLDAQQARRRTAGPPCDLLCRWAAGERMVWRAHPAAAVADLRDDPAPRVHRR